MIQINLLPPEMRKVDRTSLKRLLSMVAAVALVSGSIIGVAVYLKGYYSEVSKNQFLNGEVTRLEPQAKEYDVLNAELGSIQTRIATIDEIRSTRLRWGQKLDQLYAILPDYVWFDKVTLKQVRGTAAASKSTLVLDCYLAGADEKRYAEFRRVLTGDVVADTPYSGADFFSSFADLGYSGWSREEFTSTEEGIALKFSLEMELKALTLPEQPQKVVRPVVAAK